MTRLQAKDSQGANPVHSRLEAGGSTDAGGTRLPEEVRKDNRGSPEPTVDRVTEKQLKRLGIIPCKTCQNRRYQDQSSDPGVSMKAPTALSPAVAGVTVAAHENEHVQRERAQAAREGKEVIYQYVQLYMATCPECGRVYVAGGKTVTVAGPAKSEGNKEPGKLVNIYA
ncbi:hypothetical protein Slip_0278 [Syntrophothermus lipocalidus DSM 12680]|uniref:Uncharacterized protein n=2 Tax=Syntrophothermus TaxID=129001 RepID=D7CJV1_SYNLT|nr:hypothetical protein Slip_0278 [Syntrophothermus lipocalidus DSM 12680]